MNHTTRAHSGRQMSEVTTFINRPCTAKFFYQLNFLLEECVCVCVNVFFIDKIFFTIKANFYPDAFVNKQNYCICGTENPRMIQCWV